MRDSEGKWVDATIARIEPHYRYAVSFPPDRRFVGGEIAGLGAVFEENESAYGIRPKP